MAGYPSSLYFTLRGDTRDSDTKLKDVQEQLRKLTDHSYDVKIDGDDALGKAKIKQLSADLRKLSETTARPGISTLQIDKADIKVDLLKAKLDELDHRHVEITADVKVGDVSKLKKTIADIWKKLIPGSSENEGSSAESAGGGLLDNPAAAYGIGGGIGILAALLPSVVGLGIGGLVGGAGAAGAISQSAGLKSQGSGLLVRLLATTSGLAGHPQQSFKSPTESTSHITSQATGLYAVFDQLQKLIGVMTPALQKMFSASMPFITSFTGAMTPIMKSLIPAFTGAMNEMEQSGALKEMTQGLVLLVKDGLVPFIQVLGPGMKASATVFKAVVLGLDDVLVAFGAVCTFIARDAAILGRNVIDIGKVFADIGKIIAALVTGNWAAMGRAVDSLGDDFRNFLATIVDSLDGGFVKISTFAHDVANIFDVVRHETAVIWDDIWSYLTNEAGKINTDVGHWFQRLATGIWNDVKALPGQFLGLGKGMLADLLNGLKQGANPIESWIKGFASGVVGIFKKIWGWFSPSSVMFEGGKSLMQGLEKGLKSHEGSIQLTIGGIGKNVAQWLMEALAITHKPMSWLPALEKLVSKESGGNPRAVDPVSVDGEHAEGLIQMLPSTFAAHSLGGSIFNPVANAVSSIRYISSEYGSPFSIPGLFSGDYRGYAAGGMIREPIIGMGLNTGSGYSFGELGPERISPAGSGGGSNGDTYIIQVPQTATDPDAFGREVVQALTKYKKHRGLPRNTANGQLGIG